MSVVAGRPIGLRLIKLFELGVHTLGGLFLGVWYARRIDFRHFSRFITMHSRHIQTDDISGGHFN